MKRPRLSLIVARARNGVIGRENRLPWHLPVDLQRFKRLTMGKPMVMGRRTWESLPGRLPGRRHIVVSRNPDCVGTGVEVVPSLEAAITRAGAVPEVMVIGGARLYAAALPLADRIYLTEVEADVAGDAFFPALDFSQWRVVSQERAPADERNPHACTFLVLDRRWTEGAGGGDAALP